MDSTKKLNPAVSKAVWIAGLGNLEITLVMASLCVPLILWLFGSQWIPFYVPVAMLVAMLVCAFALLANKPHRFLEQLYRKKAYVVALQKIRPGSKFAPAKLKKTHRQGKRLISALEAHSDLIAVVEFELNGKSVGGYLLKNATDDLFVTFGWSLGGIDPALTLDAAERYNNNVDKGFRRLPPGALLTFSYHSHSGELSEIDDLEALREKVPTDLEKTLIDSQIDSLRQLDKDGHRQTKKLYAFLQVPCTVAEDIGALSQMIEAINAKFSQGRKNRLNDKAYVMRALANAYNGGFAPIHGALSKNFGHKIKPLSHQELFTIDYLELHQHADDVIIPQHLKLTSNNLKVVKLPVDCHTNYYLFKSQLGRPAAPVNKDQFVYLPITRQYTGFYQIGKATAYEHPEGAALGQLNFLTELLNEAGLHDYKITTQFGTTPPQIEAYLIRRSGRSQRKLAAENLAKLESTVKQDQVVEDAEAAEGSVNKGERILTFGCLVQLYADDPDKLDIACTNLQNTIGAIAPSERCWHQSDAFWKQIQRWSTTELLKKPYNRQDKILSSNASGYVPAVKPKTFDKRGIHFLTRTGLAPLHIDIFNKRSHLAIYASTRMGKSVLMADIMLNFYMKGIPAVAFDFPDPTSGRSTYTDMVKLIKAVGGDAEYFDVARESSSILEMADYRHGEEPEIMRRSALSFQEQAIKLLVLGTQTAEAITADVSTFVDECLAAFHDEPQIIERYEAAWDEGFGTESYQRMPTLFEFADYYDQWEQQYRKDHPMQIDERANEALALIGRMLRSRLASKLKRSIAEPSTINPKARLIVFALTAVNDPVEASVYALAGYNALLRQSMSARECAFFLDELPILFKLDSIPPLVGDLCSNGLKWGCRVILSGQNIDAIIATPAAQQILTTIQRTIIGGIEQIAIPGLTKVGVNEGMLGLYTHESRAPDPTRLMSSWIIKVGQDIVETLYKPSDMLLALVANNPDEQIARAQVMDQYPEQPVEGLRDFSRQYATAIRQGKPLATITETFTAKTH